MLPSDLSISRKYSPMGTRSLQACRPVEEKEDTALKRAATDDFKTDEERQATFTILCLSRVIDYC